MIGSKGWERGEKDRSHQHGLQPHQLMAAGSPAIPSKQLVADNQPQLPGGNFQDLESLLDQLGQPPVFELGKPLPNQKHLPKRGLGSCPAAHNRALLDEDLN